MQNQSFGDRESLSIEINGPAVDVFVAGVHITDFDNSPYLPSFVPSLSMAESSLRSCLNFLKYEELFFGMSVDEGYAALRDASQPPFVDAYSQLRFADWGPTTDGYLCFLLPILGNLYIATCEVGGQSVRSVAVQPYSLISTIRQALEALRPNQSLEPTRVGKPPLAAQLQR